MTLTNDQLKAAWLYLKTEGPVPCSMVGRHLKQLDKTIAGDGWEIGDQACQALKEQGKAKSIQDKIHLLWEGAGTSP